MSTPDTGQPITDGIETNNVPRELAGKAQEVNYTKWQQNPSGLQVQLNAKQPAFFTAGKKYYEKQGFKEADIVDLHTLPPQSVVILLGSYRLGANYIIEKIDAKTVRVWRHENDALVGNLDDIAVFDFNSLDQTTDTGNLYPGVLFKGTLPNTKPLFAMPIFNNDLQGNLTKPTQTWTDSPVELYVR